MKARSKTTTSAQPEYQAGVSHVVAVALLAMGTACQVGGGPDAAAAAPDDTVVELPMPIIHHVGLNVIDPGASMAWYQLVWPDGEPSTLDGRPAFRSAVRGSDPPQDLFHVFNQAGQPAPGKWDADKQRTTPQSAFWHIGMFVDTTSLKKRFDAVGVTMAPMWETLDGREIWRSGESRYPGMLTMAQIEETGPQELKAGGFGYLIGPDGELVETAGGPRSRRGFDHIHFFHEQPWCAAKWYIDHLGMRPPLRRDPTTKKAEEIEIPSPCEVEFGPPSFPSLEPRGTLRAPSSTVRYGNGAMSAYTRQCRFGRCGEDQPLVSSKGQVLEHVGFSIPDLDIHIKRLRSEGVQVVQEIHSFGETRAAMIADLDGLLLHLVEQR